MGDDSNSECGSDDEVMEDEDDEPIGANIYDYYTIGKEIGKGAFSVVREGVSKSTGHKVAIKSIRTKFIKTKLVLREIEIMKRVGDHPNILKLYEVYESKNFLFLVLELVTGGELFDQIVARGEYSEKDASNIVRQIVSAVAHLHANGIAHRDLKPQNLLCVSPAGDDIRVADFGLSKMFNNGEFLETCCGSPEYVAPEVLDCKRYDAACDMWSVGVITYVLLTGCFPFWNKNNALLYDQIKRGIYKWPDGLEVSEAARDLVGHLIEKNPERRYTAEQALQHPWVTGQNVPNVKNLSSSVPSRRSSIAT